jgi:hypothetical protein
VTTSLVNQMKTHPAVGWVRGDQIPDENALETINRLYRECEALKKELDRLKQAQPAVAGLAEGGVPFDVAYTLVRPGAPEDERDHPFTWDELFMALAPTLLIGERSARDIYGMLEGIVRTKRLSHKGGGTAYNVT